MKQKEKPLTTQTEQPKTGQEAFAAGAAQETPAAEALLFRRPFLWVSLLCTGLLLVLLVAFPLWGTWPQMPVMEHFDDMTEGEKLDLNTADLAALCTLPGIGAAKAQAILDWRQVHGKFTSLEQLLQVEGIGEKLFAELKERVYIGTK